MQYIFKLSRFPRWKKFLCSGIEGGIIIPSWKQSHYLKPLINIRRAQASGSISWVLNCLLHPSCIMLRTQKSHMTYIFICSSLKLLYIGFGYECFFLWKGQTLHMYHQCKALLIKKQAGEFVKVIEILLMWGESLAVCWKRNGLWTFSERRWGSLSLVITEAFSFCVVRPEAVWGTPVQKEAGTLPPPALSCMRVHTLASVRETPSSVNSSTTPQTPVEHLEVELGKVPWPDRCKPNLGFPVVRRLRQPLSANLQHQREPGESWTLTFKPKVHGFKCPSSSVGLTFESECSEKIKLV